MDVREGAVRDAVVIARRYRLAPLATVFLWRVEVEPRRPDASFLLVTVTP